MKYQSNSSKHLIPIVVGVTGHRDLREEDIPELKKKVEAIFKEIKNKYYDYRALAEGLRVQFFWKLMSSKENTYDHYLRKYMGEMDWIFQTVNP